MTFRVNFKALEGAEVKFHPDHPYHDGLPADTRFPMYQAIWCESEYPCVDCHTKGTGYRAPLVDRRA